MIFDFLDSILEILKKFNLTTHFPNVSTIFIDNNGICNHFFNVETIDGTQFNNIIISSLLVFDLFDTSLDLLSPNLEGLPFDEKYKQLPKNSDGQLILKEIYRILKNIRNTSIHAKSKIYNKQNIFIKNPYKKIDIEITKIGMEYIYTAILYWIKNKHKINKYTESFLRYYFYEINNNIKIFSDKHGNLNQLSNSNGLVLKMHRYKFENPKSSVINNFLEIEKYDKLDDFEIGKVGIDYVIKLNQQNYLIPSEVLSKENRISLSEINDWIE